MTKKRIYISGQITGIENEAPKLFAAAEAELKAKGYDTINPLTLNHDHDKTWSSYMKEDIKALCDCDGIYMLRNWERSKGACIERELAVRLGLIIIHQNA